MMDSSLRLVFAFVVLLAAPSCAGNLYRKLYQDNLHGRTLAGEGLLASSGPVQVIAGGDRRNDDARMLESGHRMVGLVFFDGVDQGAPEIEEVAREVGAAVAISYKRPCDSSRSALRAQRHAHRTPVSHTRPRGPRCDELGATFWAMSVQAPSVGAFIQDRVPTEAGEEEAGAGLRVIAVVRASPADICGVRQGDTLTRVAGRKVDSAAGYLSEVNAALGKTIEFEIRRDGAARTVTCEVGSRPETLVGVPPDR
ncbi:MAG: PDZ domain-containing protein [Deltaproteobacteria bacterium]|nr:PDZ domain-containing protein [Deltaproteobacteria bacterium]